MAILFEQFDNWQIIFTFLLHELRKIDMKSASVLKLAICNFEFHTYNA